MPPRGVSSTNRCCMTKEYEETDRHGGLTPRRTKVLMALVALATALAIWLVPVDDEQGPPSLPPLPSAADSATDLPLPPLPSAPDSTADLPLPSTTGGIAAVINGGDQARAFLAGLRDSGSQPEPGVVFAEAERMQGAGNLEDAYLLYRYAARHGHAQAAMILGTQADPAWHSVATSYLPEPDPGQAYKWYSIAAGTGSQKAALRLQQLHERLQQDAESGDEQARRLLLQWR